MAVQYSNVQCLRCQTRHFSNASQPHLHSLSKYFHFHYKSNTRPISCGVKFMTRFYHYSLPMITPFTKVYTHHKLFQKSLASMLITNLSLYYLITVILIGMPNVLAINRTIMLRIGPNSYLRRLPSRFRYQMTAHLYSNFLPSPFPCGRWLSTLLHHLTL
jgi:hypothetical protein